MDVVVEAVQHPLFIEPRRIKIKRDGMRFRLHLAYHGGAYHGWQRQPNAVTVQEVIERALSQLFQQEIELIGAGRTDTGVHARFYVAHFDATALPIPTERLLYVLNGLLPRDIVLFEIAEASPTFHARFDATRRTYEYLLLRHKDPFLTDEAYLYTAPLDFQRLNEGAHLLTHYEDFASFCKTGTDAHTTICHLFESTWEVKGNLWVYRVAADRFLRNMVRALVGTLLDLGRKRISLNEFQQIIEAKDRGMAGASAPPQGLYLVNVEYPQA